jgi:hypothetical protein
MNESSKEATDWVHRIIMPCSEVTRILSDAERGSLTVRQGLALRVHLLVCGWCSRYQRQVQRLRATLARQSSKPEVYRPVNLSSDARDRIRRSLNDKQS